MASSVARSDASVALSERRAARRIGAWSQRMDGSILFIYALVVLVSAGAGVYSERFRDPGNLTNVLRHLATQHPGHLLPAMLHGASDEILEHEFERERQTQLGK